MVKCFFSLLLILSVNVCTAQSVEKFGKISKEALQKTICDYDKAAPAEILIDEGFTTFEWGSNNFFKMVNEYRVRIKILTTKGLDYANIKIRYLKDDRYEKIKNIVAHTYNLNGTEVVDTKLEKEQIFDSKVTDQISEVAFSMPAAVVGSIIEYKYTMDRESFSNLAPWVFQSELPTTYSSYTIAIPEYFRFTASTLATQEIITKKTDNRRSISIDGSLLQMAIVNYSYTMKNCAALNREPYMGSINDYKQRIIFQLSEIILPNKSYNYTTDWEELASELRKSDLFGMQLNKTVSTPALDILVTTATTTESKVKIIYNYFKKYYKWDGTNDIYCTNVKKIADAKMGTTGDINLLFLNKLAAYKIEAYPLLVSTKANGSVNMMYPFLKQFNAIYALIPNGKSNYIINAADGYNSYTNLPPTILNTNALIIKKDVATWYFVKAPPLPERETVAYQLTVQANGNLTGSAFVVSEGISKLNKLKAFDTDKDNFTKKYYNYTNLKLNANKLLFKNEYNDSVGLEQEFSFEGTVVKNGNYNLLYTNLFTNELTNPFINETRYSDVDFNNAKTIQINAYISLPEEYTLEALPKNIKLIMPDTGIIFERKIDKDENTISVNYSFKIKNISYYATEYDYIKSYFAEVINILNEPLVFVNKEKK